MALTENLQKLRALFKDTNYVQEPIQAYFIPSEDPHQSEYPGDMYLRRHFITKFTGSAGEAVVTEKEAALWTDGRYHIQAEKQLDSNWTLMKIGLPDTPVILDWISKTLEKGARVGFDPLTLSYAVAELYIQKLESHGISFVPIETNLVDIVWGDQKPADKEAKVWPLELKYTGKCSCDKVNEVREKMKENGAEMLVLTLLDDVAWLLNLRGCDIENTPVFYSYVIVTMDNVKLFVNKKKLGCLILSHFNSENIKVDIHSYDKIIPKLTEMIPNISQKIWINEWSSYGLVKIVPEEKRLMTLTPVTIAKNIKNDVEAAGMINAHIKDGVAVCKFLAWLYKEIQNGTTLDEIAAGDKLTSFRMEQEDFVSLSFPNISASGPNASIIHYDPQTAETSRKLSVDEIYLIDSGGQYKDGTTDVTRTVHFGTPTEEEKEMFTRVLKGQIAIKTAIVPKGFPGARFEGFSRRYLWEVGYDFMHGLSHGVGMCLGVHEAPARISSRHFPDDIGMLPNIFLTNEPGFYLDGKFGIRIEDVLRVVPVETRGNFRNQGAVTFESITMVPLDRKLIDGNMLTQKEIECIDDYHRVVRETIGPVLIKCGTPEELKWLMTATDPVKCQCG